MRTEVIRTLNYLYTHDAETRTMADAMGYHFLLPLRSDPDAEVRAAAEETIKLIEGWPR